MSKYKNHFYALFFIAISIIFIFFNSSNCLKMKNFSLIKTNFFYNNNEYNLEKFLGKPVIINFFATWCSSCLSELSNFVSLANEYKNNVFFIGFAIDSEKKKINDIVKSFNITYPIIQKSLKDIENLNIYLLPTTYILDSNGKIFWIKRGKIKKNKLSNVIIKLITRI